MVDFPEDKTIVYAKQTDITFGENIYKYEYLSYDDMLVFTQTNLTTMKYGILSLLGKNKLLSLVAIIDAEDCLLVYSATLVKASLLPGIEGKVRDSFSNRADAVYGWFKASADRTFVR
jgi:ribosomal protein L30E